MKIKEEKGTKKEDFLKIVSVVFILILLFSLAFSVGLNRIVNSNFFPINGDFQNYNPIRRLLAGQIPYKDFAVYLGNGHLFLLSIIQLLIGNNFTLSLFNTNITTFIMFELATFVISFFVCKNKKQSLYNTLIAAVFNLARGDFINKIIGQSFVSGLSISIAPQNSARLIRNIIMIISVLLIWIGVKYINKSQRPFIKEHKNILQKIYWAIIAGATIPWSNDGGISTYIIVSFVYFLLLIKQYKTNIKSIILYTLMYIAISISVVALVITIITRGHPMSWVEFTLGVSSYQRWYYGSGMEKNNISILDIQLTPYTIALAIFGIYYIYKLFKSENIATIIKYALLTIIAFQPITSAYLYQFISGANSREFSNLIVFILLFAYISKFIVKWCKSDKLAYASKTLIIVICTVITANLVISAKNKFDNRNSKDATYISELGGYFTNYTKTMVPAIEKVGNSKMFSTYASAIDTATNNFQPTGIDYIIHCLSDKQRAEYLETFKKGEFDYVTTTEKDYYGTYQYWIRDANWFFYKELYKNYIPYFETEYNVFWKKAEKKPITKKAEINVEVRDLSLQAIKVKTDSTFNGIANVKISYDSHFTKDFWKKLIINRFVTVEDTAWEKYPSLKGIDYNLPCKSDEYYIPVVLIDGKGEVTIRTYPRENTLLEIKNAEVIEIFDDNFAYTTASAFKDIEENAVYLDNNEKTGIMLKNAKAIKIGDIQESIEEISIEGGLIKLSINGDSKPFAYPYCFEIIKEGN